MADADNGDQGESREEQLDHVDRMNAAAIAETVHIFMEQVETRLQALENEVATQRGLVNNQSRVIGEAMAAMMGKGSTVQE
jgi:hypothetical protein